MIEDIKTLLWFLKRPKFYFTMLSLIYRKFLVNRDNDLERNNAKFWCQKHCISIEEMFEKFSLDKRYLNEKEIFEPEYIKKINNIINHSNSNFGGQAFIDLLFLVCESIQVKSAIETGVAYGWSTASILKSLSKRSGILVSVDMPMVKQQDYHLIGVAVKKDYYKNWFLLREPDKFGLLKAIKKLNYSFQIAHYDSDKTYYGRKWAYPILYKYLDKSGFFISDDIEDNMYFSEFVIKNKLNFAVLHFEDKYIGVVRKG